MFITSRFWKVQVASMLLVVGGMLSVGCSKGDAAADEAGMEDVAYRLGDPIQDSTYAAIVQGDGGADTLTTEEFNEQYQAVLQQFPTVQGNLEQSRELRRRILENFVLQYAVMGEAKRLSLEADTAAVETQLRQIQGRFPSQTEFEQALASENMTVEDLRSQIRDFELQRILQERFESGAATPTEQEMETFRQEQAEQIRAQHILFLVERGAGPEADSSAKTEAAAVLDSVKAGNVPFEDLARRHSDDGSASLGGDLNYFGRGQMVPTFEEAAFALQDSGDVTQELVRTPFGYHIIRLTGRRTGELMDTTRARQMLLSQRRQESIEGEVERLKGTVVVRINPQVVDTDLNEPLDM